MLLRAIHMNIFSKLQSQGKAKYAYVMLAAMVLGIITMLFSKALSPSNLNVEPENGSAPGMSISDSSASNGGAVRFGQTYQSLYVSTSGSDSNNGQSQATALLTIGAAVQKATGYTRIRVLAGTYIETIRIQKNNLIIEPFGNGDVVINGAIKEFINGAVSWQNVQTGIYKTTLPRVDHVTDQSSTIYAGNGDQWWSYNSLNGLLNRQTKNNLPGVRMEHQLFTGNSEVYVATDDNQPPDVPLYIGGAWPTIDIQNADNIRINSLANAKLKITYGNNNIQIRNSSNVTIDNTEIIGGTYGIYAYDSTNLNFKNNSLKGKFGRTWTFSDVKNYPASMENAAIIVRANTKNISNIVTDGNDISGYWAAIYYQTLDNLLSPSSPDKFYNENSLIVGNTVHDIAGPGIETEAYLRNLIVKGNVVYDAGEAYSPAPVRDGPVYVYQNLFVANRVMLDVLGEATSGPGQAIKMNNDHVVPPENIHFYFNTFYYAGNDTNAMKTVHTTPSVLTQNVSFTNNIFYSLDGGILRGSGRAVDGVEFDGNIFYSEQASAKKFFAWNSYYDEVHSYASLGAIIGANAMPSQWQANVEGNPNFNCVDFTNATCFKPGASIAKPSILQPIPSGYAESARLNSRSTLGAFE